MPQQTPGKRASGGGLMPPRTGRVRLPWDDWPPLPVPDQSRYGTATDTPRLHCTAPWRPLPPKETKK